MQPPPQFQSHGRESERIPLNQIEGLYEVKLHKMALDAEGANSGAAILKAEAKAAYKSRPNWDPTGFSDPKYHFAAYKGKSFLSGSGAVAPANEAYIEG